MSSSLFDTAPLVVAVAGSTVAMYVALLAGVRIAGRRTVVQMSAFDAIITITLGSVLATTIVSPRPQLLSGLSATATLLALQVVLGWLRRRSAVIRRWVDFAPMPLMRAGKRVDGPGLFGPQITDEELLSALRARGIFDTDDVETLIIEPSGELSVRRRD